MPARAPAVEIAAERVGHLILVIRRQRVLLDKDLAALYGVETRAVLQAVKRISRFLGTARGKGRQQMIPTYDHRKRSAIPSCGRRISGLWVG
jgi:ORF6N domain